MTSPSKIKKAIQRETQIFEALEVLKNELPLAFRRGEDKLPLKRKIRDDVINHYKDDKRFKPHIFKGAIGIYVNGRKYLKAHTEGAARIDLNGNVVDYLTKANADYAMKSLEQRRKIRNIIYSRQK